MERIPKRSAEKGSVAPTQATRESVGGGKSQLFPFTGEEVDRYGIFDGKSGEKIQKEYAKRRRRLIIDGVEYCWWGGGLLIPICRENVDTNSMMRAAFHASLRLRGACILRARDAPSASEGPQFRREGGREARRMRRL